MGGQLISGSQVTTAEVDSAHWSWTDRAKNRWQEYRSETTTSRQALDSIRAWADRNPMTVSTTFDNEAGPDFSDIFEEAPVISDTSRLKDYAMHLRDLMAERDTAALFEEFRPSIMDRFEMRSFESRARYIEENRNAVVLEGAILDFDRDDVRVRRWVDGRVWEIWWAGSENEAFFERPSGYGTGELYVAEVDGTLRVVR